MCYNSCHLHHTSYLSVKFKAGQSFQLLSIEQIMKMADCGLNLNVKTVLPTPSNYVMAYAQNK
jgi:hypothetical protein